LGFVAGDSEPLGDAGRGVQLEAFAHQVAGALERTLLAEEAKQSELRVRTEELRNALLSSVSHDLRTPLSAIMGSASTLLEDRAAPLAPAQVDLARAVYEEAERLSRLVTNLLAMTRVESPHLALRREWVPLEEIVGAALERLGGRLAMHRVSNHVPADVIVSVDPVLIEQVFVNLFDNAVRYTPAGSTLEITGRQAPHEVTVEIADDGPGLPSGFEARIFEKFVRGPRVPSGGSGLGLAICRAVMLAHGGRIEATSRPGGGALFRLTIPLEGAPPAVPREEAMMDVEKA
jgi:two-component system sensor histidine kinase KdpD